MVLSMPVTKEKRQTGILLCTYAYLTIFFLPVVDYYCSWFISMIPVILTFFFVIRNHDYKIPWDFLMLFVLFLFNMLMFYWGVYRYANLEWIFSMEFIPLLPFMFAYAMKDMTEPALFKRTVQYVAVLLFITSFTSLWGYNFYPEASRELASGTALYNTIPYVKANIGGYDFIYALVLFIPVAIWLIINTAGLARIFNVAALLTYYLCIYKSKYAIALLCAIVAAIMVLFIYSKKSVAWAAVAALVTLLVFRNVIAYALMNLSMRIEYQYMADRIMEAAALLTGRDVSLATSDKRLELYQQALSAFGSSPLIGHNLISYNRDVLSRHSAVMDIVAGLGLAGLAAYIMLFLKLFGLSVAPFRSVSNRFIVIVLLLFFILSVFNTNYYSMFFVVTVLCTSCIHWYDKRVEETEAAAI